MRAKDTKPNAENELLGMFSLELKQVSDVAVQGHGYRYRGC